MKREQTAVEEITGPIDNGDFQVSTALVVDDEKDICYLLRTILKQKNISSTLAGSLTEAVKFIETSGPSVIFLDNYLPDGLGLDNIQRLKRISPISKIIMITAHDTISEREKAFREGVDFFIVKPFSRKIILKTLDEIEGRNYVE